MILEKLDDLRGQHWVLDGFPRTLQQGKLLDGHLSQPLSLIVNLNVPDDVIISRIAGELYGRGTECGRSRSNHIPHLERWVHPASGRVYNTSYNKPRVEGRDDVTGEALVQRPDDNEVGLFQLAHVS